MLAVLSLVAGHLWNEQGCHNCWYHFFASHSRLPASFKDVLEVTLLEAITVHIPTSFSPFFPCTSPFFPVLAAAPNFGVRGIPCHRKKRVLFQLFIKTSLHSICVGCFAVTLINAWNFDGFPLQSPVFVGCGRSCGRPANCFVVSHSVQRAPECLCQSELT